MKILTVCLGGLVRSVAAAEYLKVHTYHDVIPCGVALNSPYTLDALYTWAHRIIVVAEEDIKNQIPVKFRGKVIHVDIGLDVWGRFDHPDLTRLIQEKLAPVAKELGAF